MDKLPNYSGLWFLLLPNNSYSIYLEGVFVKITEYLNFKTGRDLRDFIIYMLILQRGELMPKEIKWLAYKIYGSNIGTKP